MGDDMETYIDYINKELPDEAGDKILYKYKRRILDEMTQRANEITARGLTDRKVIDDLVKSEYPNLAADYKQSYAKEKAKANARRNIILNVVGSVVYLIAVVIVFLTVSFVTKAWEMTWAIVADGVLLWVVYLLFLGTAKFAAMKKIFHIIARVFLAGAVMVSAVAAYLAVLALTDDIPRRWLILIFGLLAMFLCDALFCTVHRHKLAILCWLLYIPVMATFAFIIIGAAGLLPWSVAWIIIPLSLVLDFIIICIAIAKNKAESQEVEAAWNES